MVKQVVVYDTETGEISQAVVDAFKAANPTASTTVAGIVELATTTEATTGTDTTRAVTPAGVAAAIAGVGGGVTDHGALSGLADDDHTQYALADGTRGMFAAITQPINAQTGTTYTLVAADASKLVTCTNAAAITVTVPANVFTAGQRVDVAVLGEGMVTLVGSGITLNPEAGLSLVSRAQYSAFTIYFLDATTAFVTGSMAAA